MRRRDWAAYGASEPLLDSVKRLPRMSHAGHGTSLRETVYKGHAITIETTYRITIDGQEKHLPMIVTDDGRVHCHSIPNYSTPSALDLVQAIIDLFPDEFPADTDNGKARKPQRSRKRTAGGSHGDHSEGHHR